MEQIKRQRLSEQDWREIVARQTQSGLTNSQFCQLEGIHLGSLYRWRSRLRRRRPVLPTPKPQTVAKRPEEIAAPGFVELGSLSRSASRFEIRLELGEGLALHLVRS